MFPACRRILFFLFGRNAVFKKIRFEPNLFSFFLKKYSLLYLILILVRCHLKKKNKIQFLTGEIKNLSIVDVLGNLFNLILECQKIQ